MQCLKQVDEEEVNSSSVARTAFLTLNTLQLASTNLSGVVNNKILLLHRAAKPCLVQARPTPTTRAQASVRLNLPNLTHRLEPLNI